MRLISGRPVIGRPIREAFPDLDDQPFFDLLDGVFRSGEPWTGERVPVLYDRHGNGIREDATFNIVYQPLIASDGQCSGLLVHAVEVDSR